VTKERLANIISAVVLVGFLCWWIPAQVDLLGETADSGAPASVLWVSGFLFGFVDIGLAFFLGIELRGALRRRP
jgi:hypothetical protein